MGLLMLPKPIRVDNYLYYSSVGAPGYFPAHIYVTKKANGTGYRGYLGYYYPAEHFSYAYYSGVLYRQDIPNIPIPSKIEIPEISTLSNF